MLLNKVKRGESETKLRLRRTVSAANFGNAARAARRGYTTIDDDEGKLNRLSVYSVNLLLYLFFMTFVKIQNCYPGLIC